MDTTDKELLNLLQNAFPLCERPFREMGKQFGLTEDEVIQRVQKLKDDKIIRQISAIFDTKSLGYESSLVAAKVSEDKLKHAVRVINGHPGVSHNYLRNHDFNVWFTIAVPPNSALGLHKTLDIIAEEAEVESLRALPTLKLFKIGVKLDMTGKQKITGKEEGPKKKKKKEPLPPITEQEIAFVRSLQQHLKITPEPFKESAESLNMSYDELFSKMKEFIENGRMRRFAAVLHHRKAGFSYNAMGVWAVPEEEAEKVGETMASFKAVSHCYRRPLYEDWKYNIFTMVHGKSKEDCEEILAEISRETGITDRSALYSTQEYKKVRVVYFTEELLNWEKERLQKA